MSEHHQQQMQQQKPYRHVVQLTYCTGWAFKPHFLRCKHILEAYIDGVVVVGKESRNRWSGTFKLENAQTGRMYYEMKRGQPFPDEDQYTMRQVIDAITLDSERMAEEYFKGINDPQE